MYNDEATKEKEKKARKIVKFNSENSCARIKGTNIKRFLVHW